MTRFPHMELSDPNNEFDNLRFMTVRSPALNRRADTTLFVPPGCEEHDELPVCLLLHGVYGSHWAWAFSGGAHRTAQRLNETGVIKPMVLVMPSDGLLADGSGYLATADENYEQWIIEDLRNAVTEALPCVGESSKWFISGLSMGGYGALRLGAKYPEKFCGISGHSSITHVNQLKEFVEDPPETYGPQDPNDVDVAYWINEHQTRLPPLRFDCGKDDLLIEANRALHERLESARAPHTYEEFDGAHTWEYWQLHLEDTLRFFDAQY